MHEAKVTVKVIEQMTKKVSMNVFVKVRVSCGY